jgi:hypothetical protein
LACPIRRLTVKGSMPLAINAEACGNGGRRPGSRNKLAEEAFNIALKLVNEDGEQAMREVMLKEPAKFCQLMVALIPQHFKHEVEHTIAGLSPDEVRARLAESRAKLLDAGIDLEALPVVEALPAPRAAGRAVIDQ